MATGSAPHRPPRASAAAPDSPAPAQPPVHEGEALRFRELEREAEQRVEHARYREPGHEEGCRCLVNKGLMTLSRAYLNRQSKSAPARQRVRPNQPILPLPIDV